MKPPSFSLMQWYDQREKRERIVLLVCAIAVVVFLLYTLLLQPITKQLKKANKDVITLKSDLENMAIEEAAIMVRKESDPNRNNRLRLDELEAESAQLQQQLETSIVNLVSPRDMPELLKSLITQQKKLQLIGLENIAPERLNLDLPTDDKTVVPTLYKHRLNLEFSGDYLTMLNYLRQLEKLPRAMVWEQVAIESLEYPKTTVRLQVYTLSLTEGWIGG